MKIVKPQADIISYPTDSLSHVYRAARRCYSGGSLYDLDNEIINSSRESMAKLVKACIRSGHESILEHASYTFHVVCSRAASMQFVRHRLATYSQESQRYCDMSDAPVIMPEAMNTWKRRAVWKAANHISFLAYRILMAMGCAAEDARSVLPQDAATAFVVTMNGRQLRHFFEERLCNRAQLEIRGVARQMLDILKQNHDVIFDDAGPKCWRLKRCPEHKPCGMQPWKDDSNV